jgi:uncharacterized protein YjbI with pentapeptide repeats
MANPEHLEILKQGVEKWNQWRKENRGVEPDLFRVIFLRKDISGDFAGRRNLCGIDFSFSNLREADLENADLKDANLICADLSKANLVGANLTGANLVDTDFSYAKLDRADFTETAMGSTIFAATDLSQVLGLETVTPYEPSPVGIDTLYLSEGKIPESFLRDCGVPEHFITFIPSLVGSTEPFQYHSCFISYSTKDEEFARRLHSRLRDANVRVWFAPENIKGGVKLYDQIERAIQLHDRLLIVLSENSLQSEWVMTEIRKAREVEKKESRRKLFPIRLADFEQIRKWRCPDADGGKVINDN